MGTLAPSDAQIRALVDMPDDGSPIVMLNLLRYRALADYAANPGEAPCSGREAYGRYAKAVASCLESVGASIVSAGAALATVIGPPDERWDDVLLVRYPSRAAFLGMIASEGYRAIAHHRTAAVEDSRLVAIAPGAPSFAR